MTDDYYEAAPRRIPRIPLAVCGFFGSGHDQVGLALGSLTALPAMNVAELIEHDAGSSTANIVRTEGFDGFRTYERAALDRALQSTPPGVVILGVSTPLTDENLEAITERSALIYVHRSRDRILAEIRRRNATKPGGMAPWIPAGDVDESLVVEMFEVLEPRYERAMLRVDSTEASPQTVAREIIGQFDLWSDDPA